MNQEDYVHPGCLIPVFLIALIIGLILGGVTIAQQWRIDAVLHGHGRWITSPQGVAGFLWSDEPDSNHTH